MKRIKENYLKKLYFNLDSPVAYTSVSTVWNYIKKNRSKSVKNITKKNVEDFLNRYEGYALHRSVQRKFPRRQIYAKHIDQLGEFLKRKRK